MGLGKKTKDEVLQVAKGGRNKEEIQDTLIGASTEIVGDIKSEKSLRIDGKITGNIQAKHRIVIGEEGYIKGNLKAESIILYGKIEGDIEAHEILEIMNTGKLVGNVKVKGFTIQAGGIFCGNSKMSEQESKKIDLSKSTK